MILFILNKLKDFNYKYLVDHYPRVIIDKIWKRKYGYIIDWNHPRDLNEKIEWLICYGDTSGWPDLADKYKVRDYVWQKGFGEMLTRLYGIWNDAGAIDFNALPDRFVLKCNHDCGTSRIIDKTRPFDREDIVRHFNDCLKTKYGYNYCEPHYNKIKPLLFAEEYLPPDISLSSSQIDYKVWCFEGKATIILVCHSREQDSLLIDVYDLDWNAHPEYCVFSSKYKDGQGVIPRPVHLEEMVRTAEVLSTGLHEARIDFYSVKGRLYFGEITLTSASGRMTYFTKEFLVEIGNRIQL